MTTPALAWVAGLTVVAATALAGCGGGSPHTGVASLTGRGGAAKTGTTSTTASKQTATQLWREAAACMRQHGVDMPDPVLNSDGLPGGVQISGSSGPIGADQQALQACQAKLDAAMKATGGPGSAKIDPAQAAKFSKCMRAHGVSDFPDPGASGRLVVGGNSASDGPPPGDLNPDSPVLQKAQKACGGLLPGGSLTATGGKK
jgi:hypothetical protein